MAGKDEQRGIHIVDMEPLDLSRNIYFLDLVHKSREKLDLSTEDVEALEMVLYMLEDAGGYSHLHTSEESREEEEPAPIWHILKQEVWVQGVDIQAATLKEAIDMVCDGEGDDSPEGLEYSDTLGVETWTAWDNDCGKYYSSAQLMKEISKDE